MGGGLLCSWVVEFSVCFAPGQNCLSSSPERLPTSWKRRVLRFKVLQKLPLVLPLASPLSPWKKVTERRDYDHPYYTPMWSQNVWSVVLIRAYSLAFSLSEKDRVPTLLKFYVLVQAENGDYVSSWQDKLICVWGFLLNFAVYVGECR